jgi:hypothetical protein
LPGHIIFAVVVFGSKLNEPMEEAKSMAMTSQGMALRKNPSKYG